MPTGGTGNTVLLETIKRSEKKVERDIKRADEQGELRPAQTKQPAINVAPSPDVGVDLHELNLPSADGMKRPRFYASSAEFR